jgi:hypothetical protein
MRMYPLLMAVWKLWSRHPDQRFLQLVCNLPYLLDFPEDTLYYVEDDVLLEKLRELNIRDTP